MPTLKSIPTNVITGFLGVGKSTAILNLFKQKPRNERWAVLVNEFGEVGIDGSVLQGQKSAQPEVFIQEVPGGCMCCSNGVPMQVALNALLTLARPHRLLIEPTGLGHPKEVLEVLSSTHYQELLELQATTTLVDARKVRDTRYTDHPTFVQQLAVADVIVANKADQYDAEDFPELLGFLETRVGLDNKPVFKVSHGALQLDWLNPPASQYQSNINNQRNMEHHHETPLPAIAKLPETGYLVIDNQGEGYYSRGWVFDPKWLFDADQISCLLLGVDAERVKGVFNTNKGIISFNKADDVLTESFLNTSLDSRIECICRDKSSLEFLSQTILECVLHK